MVGGIRTAETCRITSHISTWANKRLTWLFLHKMKPELISKIIPHALPLSSTSQRLYIISKHHHCRSQALNTKAPGRHSTALTLGLPLCLPEYQLHRGPSVIMSTGSDNSRTENVICSDERIDSIRDSHPHLLIGLM